MTETNTRRSAEAASDLAVHARRLADGLAARAHRYGLIEIAYTTADSPFGPLLLAASPKGLIAIGLPTLPHDSLLDRLASRISPRILRVPSRLDQVRKQLDEYFSGQRESFDLTLDYSLRHGFLREALRVVAAIPYGATLSYAEVAAEAGSPRAHRAAGTACATNPIPIVIPCHRVLRSDGGIGGYGGGLEMKRALLKMEQGRR